MCVCVLWNLKAKKRQPAGRTRKTCHKTEVFLCSKQNEKLFSPFRLYSFKIHKYVLVCFIKKPFQLSVYSVCLLLIACAALSHTHKQTIFLVLVIGRNCGHARVLSLEILKSR